MILYPTTILHFIVLLAPIFLTHSTLRPWKICALHYVVCTSVYSSSTSLTSTAWVRCPNCWDTCAWTGCFPRTVHCWTAFYRPAPRSYWAAGSSGRPPSRRCRGPRTLTFRRSPVTRRRKCIQPRSPGWRWWDGRSGPICFVVATAAVCHLQAVAPYYSLQQKRRTLTSFLARRRFFAVHPTPAHCSLHCTVGFPKIFFRIRRALIHRLFVFFCRYDNTYLT